jgi:hypothetical protein
VCIHLAPRRSGGGAVSRSAAARPGLRRRAQPSWGR